MSHGNANVNSCLAVLRQQQVLTRGRLDVGRLCMRGDVHAQEGVSSRTGCGDGSQLSLLVLLDQYSGSIVRIEDLK